MIDIKDISGKILKSVIETTDCKKYEELMSLCYISLSWNDENNIQLPAGSYIEYNGEKYRLIEPYDPSFKDGSVYGSRCSCIVKIYRRNIHIFS